VRINAPPSEGAANRELLRFFSELLGLPKRDVVLSKGAGSRRKTLHLATRQEGLVSRLVALVG